MSRLLGGMPHVATVRLHDGGGKGHSLGGLREFMAKPKGNHLCPNIGKLIPFVRIAVFHATIIDAAGDVTCSVRHARESVKVLF